MLRKLAIGNVLFTLFLTSVSYAKTISLFAEPKSDAKVIGVIDPASGIVPIYTPKEGGWIKVGNPSNGNVGWIKSTDLVQPGNTTGFSFSQQMESIGKGPQTYVFKFGVPSQLTKEQTDALYNQVLKQQIIIQETFQKVIDDAFSNYNKNGTPGAGIPLIAPVVITLPDTQGVKNPQPIKNTTKTTTSPTKQ